MKNILVLLEALLFIASCGDEAPLPQPESPFSINITDPNVSGSATDTEIIATIEVTNKTNEALTLEWIRTNVQVPSNWETSVCDNVLCYPPNINSRPLSFLANETISLRLSFYPNATIGQGTADVILYDPTDRANTEQTVSYTGMAN